MSISILSQWCLKNCRFSRKKTESSIGDMAKVKVLSPIGDLINSEEVIKSVPVEVVNSGVLEDMYLVYTQGFSEDGSVVGRVLLSFSEDLSLGIDGGLFWITVDGERVLQSIYLDPDFRGGRVSSLLKSSMDELGIGSSIGPYSDSGKNFINRHEISGIDDE